MRVTMLVTTRYAADGINSEPLAAGTEHELPDNIALGLIGEKRAERSTPKTETPAAAPWNKALAAAPETGPVVTAKAAEEKKPAKSGK